MSNPEPIIDPEEPPGKGSNVSPRFRIEKRNGTAIRSSEKPLNAYPRDMILSGSISRTYHVRVKKGFLMYACTWIVRDMEPYHASDWKPLK